MSVLTVVVQCFVHQAVSVRGFAVSLPFRYLEELWKRKQSDVLRFLLRVRTWEYRQLPAVHRCSRSTRPDKVSCCDCVFRRNGSLLRFRVYIAEPYVTHT